MRTNAISLLKNELTYIEYRREKTHYFGVCTDNSNVENLKRPKKVIIRNLEIDMTQAFEIWTQDLN